MWQVPASDADRRWCEAFACTAVSQTPPKRMLPSSNQCSKIHAYFMQHRYGVQSSQLVSPFARCNCLLTYDMGCADGNLKLYGVEGPYYDLAREVELVNGVVAHGLVTRSADVAIIASAQDPAVLLPSDAR